MNDITPFAVTTDTEHNPLSQNLIYTNQDYGSLKARIMEIIQHNFNKEFTDFSESSLAMMLVELWAFLADQLSFKIDQIANELFIDTVTELANITRLANLVGFKPLPPTPAKAMFSIGVNNVVSSDLFIDTPLEISFHAGGYGEKYMELYQVDENNNPIFGNDIVIPAGVSFINNVIGIEGRTNYKLVEGTGQPWQQIPLAVPNILWGSVAVTVDDIQWKEVEFFTGWQAMPEFRVEYLEKYQAVVVFGDNKTGLIPPKGSVVKIAYRVGGGDAGNIITGAINQTVTVHVAGLRQMVTCNVSNYTRGEGGYNGDTLEEIRAKIPIYLKTQDRAVTGEDYKTICESFTSSINGSVGKAAVSLRNQGCAGNIVDIFILAKDGPIGLTKASDALKNELSQELSKKKMFSDTVCIRNGEIILTDMTINMTVKSINRQNEGLIREKAYRRIGNLLALSNFEFGQSLKDSDIIKSVADIKEIDNVDVSFTTHRSIEEGHGSISVVSVNFWEIIRPDNIAVNINYK